MSFQIKERTCTSIDSYYSYIKSIQLYFSPSISGHLDTVYVPFYNRKRTLRVFFFLFKMYFDCYGTSTHFLLTLCESNLKFLKFIRIYFNVLFKNE